ncbi:hypothetical protein Bca4012_035886 [Brassica carinata]|uniref:Uncharacterized protein n=1 Tax=Brassica carinata TaxID=52824 RepID=A0A8X8BA52_BRACI|nr:hypothetical protein Bca52824_009706 [Brassica carinata]
MDIQRGDPVDKIPMFVSALNGAIMVPSFMAITGDMPVDLRLSMLLFLLAILGAALSSFLTSGLRGRAWYRCVADASLSGVMFFCGGIIPLVFSAVLPDRYDRMQFLGEVTFAMVGAILVVYLLMRHEKKIPLPQDADGNEEPPFPLLVFSVGIVGSVLVVLLAGKINGIRSELFKDTYGCGGYNTTRKL